MNFADIWHTSQEDGYILFIKRMLSDSSYFLSNMASKFFFFLFMSDAHHGINSSTQKYQSTQSNVALTSCRQDSGSPPF